MVALRIKEQATKALPIDNRHRQLRGHGPVCNNVTPTDDGLAAWRALRVLIVDDEQDMSEGLFTRASRWGHAAHLAYHGLAALVIAADQHPDVVLLNLELPSMDGRRLARQLRLDARESDYFIIAFADWADEVRRRQCSEAGIDLLLVNPVGPSVLDVLLGLEWVRINRQRATEAGKRHFFSMGIGANHVDRNA